MGHDDPKNPHHHHSHTHGHEDDALISRSSTRTVPDSIGHSHAHDHALEAGAQVHAHPHAPVRTATRESLPHGSGVGKILHFDCFAGLAGDMIVGALIDLGVPREPIQQALDALPLRGYSVGSVDKIVSSIAATKFVVDVDQGQPYRRYRDIRAMLEAAPLGDGLKRRVLATFRVLAVAEGKIHRIDPDDVHFHEVGAVDAIVDIVSACAGFEWLGARVSCAPLPMGRGFTKSEHGIIPLPAPATVEVLRGIPTESVAIDAELVTPTGASLMRANATEFTRWPSMRPIATGFGAGTRTLPDRPNLLRVVLGDPSEQASTAPNGAFVVLEANLDDATGELIADATDALLREGALDAWTTPIGMKKGRPGWMISALTRAGEAERIARVLLANSTTLGVRVRPSDRIERPRRTVRVETSFGPVDVKVSDGDGLPVAAKPEHDVVLTLAREHKVPASVVQAAALAAFWASARTV